MNKGSEFITKISRYANFFHVELFYLNSILNFGILPVLVFQLEVCCKVDRLLTGITAQQKGTTARWYSNIGATKKGPRRCPGRVFVMAAEFLNITEKTGMVNLTVRFSVMKSW